MSWIKTISLEAATGKLKKLYKRVKSPNKQIDNILKVHSLRPHTLEGHMSLYKNVLHNKNNTLPKWYLEALGVFVSGLNNCDYCFEHHAAGMQRLINDDKKFTKIKVCLSSGSPEKYFKGRFLEGMKHAEKLTNDFKNIAENDIQALRDSGFSDGEILEINQVVCYFNYVNRMAIGLGVSHIGEVLGLSPNNNDDSENWGHS